MLTDHFFENALSRLSYSGSKKNNLLNCLDYISKKQGATINWDSISQIEKMSIENIHLYEKELGLVFNPIKISSLNKNNSLFYPILIQTENVDEFLLFLTNGKGKKYLYNPESNSKEEVNDQVSYSSFKLAWQISSINFPFAFSYSQLIKLILHFFQKDILLSLFMGLAVSAATLMTSLFSGYLLSHAHDFNGIDYFIIYLIFSLFIISSSIFNYISELYFKSVNAKVMLHSIPSIWNHLLNLPLSVSQKFKSAQLVQKVLDYESSLSMIVATTLTTLGGILALIILIGYMCVYSPLLALIYFCIYLIGVGLKIMLYPKNFSYTNSYLVDQGKLTSFLNELLLQIYKVRSANVENLMHRKWLYGLISVKTHVEKSVRLGLITWLIEAIIPILLLIIFYVFLYIYPGIIDTYHLLQLIICIGQATIIFEKLSMDMASLIHLMPGLKQLGLLLDNKVETWPSFKNANPFYGEIKLNKVSLRSPDKKSFLLKNISMHIKPGSFIGIVGPSGAGKTSLFKLLLGFDMSYTGSIEIDNENFRRLNIGLIRQQFGVVLQNTHTFPGTIFSNIAANTSITLDRAWELARYVGLEDEVAAMPMRMFTMLSDNSGESISGGQRQKIVIARALATNPKILFLDEATSALDNNSQALIFENLRLLNITLVVIAHRYSTIVNADTIYTLNKGEIIESKLK